MISGASIHHWNQTGVPVANTDTSPIVDPRCIYIDANDTMYICGHQIGYIQTWIPGSTSRIQSTTNYGDHVDYIAFDTDGYIYANSHDDDIVRRYPPGNSNGSIYAGIGSTVTGTLDYPVGVAVDDNSILYIADRNNRRIVKREPNGTSLGTVINTGSVISELNALALPRHSSDQIYI